MDDQGVIGLPVFLTVVLIVSSVVLSYFVVSIFFLQKDSDLKMTHGEINTIASEAENMYEYADQGSRVTLHVCFPESVNFVVFGDMAVDGNHEPVDLRLDEDTCSNYYFVMDDGSRQSFSSFTNFCGEDASKISVLYAGEYDVTLELVKTSSGSYVKIYPEL